MTSNEREKIKELRNLGLGYKKTAKEMSLTISAVRCVCSSLTEDKKLNGNCKNCGLKIKSIKGKKKKIFCSDKCRMQWWNSHIKEVKKAYYTIVCKCCGEAFKAYGNNQRIYCSHNCYIKNKSNKDVASNG